MHGVIARYRPFLPVTDNTPVISLQEGGTPLVPARTHPSGCEVFFKFEGLNPTGSFKDRGMTLAVSKALEEGARAFICASTGNTAASAAAYAARAGKPCWVVLPEGAVAMGKLAQARAYGARVVSVAGNFDDALNMVREVTRRVAGLALVNSVNPYRLEGQKTAAFEVVDQLGKAPDWLLIPVGNAGNISAYWRGFKEYAAAGRSQRLPVMVGVQAAGAAPLVVGHDVPDPETVATAIRIGRPASAELARAAVSESGGRFLAASDAQLLAAYAELAATHSLFAEPASAAAYAGLQMLLAQGGITGTVVCVLTGYGLKDPEQAAALGGQVTRLQAKVEELQALIEAHSS